MKAGSGELHPTSGSKGFAIGTTHLCKNRKGEPPAKIVRTRRGVNPQWRVAFRSEGNSLVFARGGGNRGRWPSLVRVRVDHFFSTLVQFNTTCSDVAPFWSADFISKKRRPSVS
jgi:hypothetical protein